MAAVLVVVVTVVAVKAVQVGAPRSLHQPSLCTTTTCRLWTVVAAVGGCAAGAAAVGRRPVVLVTGQHRVDDGC